MTASDIDNLLSSFRADIPFPTASTAERVREGATCRKRHALRPRTIALALVAALLLAGASFAAVKEVPWWQDGAPPVDPQAVALVARDNLPAHVDIARARTVAADGNAALVAVPLDATGYCLIPTLDAHAVADSRCDYQVVNARHGADDQASSFARAATPTVPAAWIVFGRITDARAARLDLGRITVDLKNGGFFLARVPGDAWRQLSGTANPGRILDASGATLRTGCVDWGPAPADAAVQQVAVLLWRDGGSRCAPQRSPVGLPLVDLDHATALTTLRLAVDVSIWKAGTTVALWQARAADQSGAVCTYVAPLSPAPHGVSRGLRGGPGQCAYPTTGAPAVQNRVFAEVGFDNGPGGLVTGHVAAHRGVAKVVLQAHAGDTDLSFGDGYFLGQLPAGGKIGELPPGGPFVLVAYDGAGNEVGRTSIDEIRRQATPR